ncbi:hypothetical protein DENSPDRAFT_863516 [Dentipellis sp. KUC8613]|nr:hypothetical protein DENSPDRAFT_863516 [Dentipellis sp. KUC8613]
MPVTPEQKKALDEVLDLIVNQVSPRKKRRIAEMFMDLVDREAWADYYEHIPAPRCLNDIRETLKDNKYKDPLTVYEDLWLVFLNAQFYNESESQIAKDAASLHETLKKEWKLRPVLPAFPTALPANSAQVKYGIEAPDAASSSAPTPAAAPAAAAPSPAPAPAPAPAPTPAAAPAPKAAAAPVPKPAAAPAPKASAPKTPAPAPSRARSPQRQSSPDVEVDVGGTPEPENMGVSDEMVRDDESDAVVRQLERGLPRWEGPGDYGWMPDGGAEDRWLEIVLAIKGHKDVIGNRLAVALESVPEETTLPYLSFSFPLSLKLVETHARSKTYASNKDFDKEMARLFEKARRWHEQGSDAYGHVLLLQRLYQALTSPSPPAGPPYASTTNFASLRAGPGTARPLHSADSEQPGVTMFRVSTKDRTFVEEVQYKGWSIRLADWLHLSNPDDPSKPIVAQVFRCYISEEPSRKGQPGVTVCWYYRPEQTFHPAHRQFWEGEVFKTSHFADHPVEDILEKIACQFTARHIRGRPRPPYWYLGWPLYVCDSRYNDRERIFVRIKNWNSCVPEEVRKSTEFMPIYPFERMVFPRRFGSPFLKGKGVRGPGGLVDGSGAPGSEGPGLDGGRKRSKRAGGGAVSATDISGPSKGLYVGVPGVAGSAGVGVGVGTGAPAYHAYVPPTPTPHAYVPPVQRPPSAQPPRPAEDRSIVAAAGVLGGAAIEKLPPETAKHFDRDPESNEVLWFAAPPVDVARVPKPRYSLEYLHWLARKRKRALGGDGAGGEAMDHRREVGLLHSRLVAGPARPPARVGH